MSAKISLEVVIPVGIQDGKVVGRSVGICDVVGCCDNVGIDFGTMDGEWVGNAVGSAVGHIVGIVFGIDGICGRVGEGGRADLGFGAGAAEFRVRIATAKMAATAEQTHMTAAETFTRFEAILPMPRLADSAVDAAVAAANAAPSVSAAVE